MSPKANSGVQGFSHGQFSPVVAFSRRAGDSWLWGSQRKVYRSLQMAVFGSQSLKKFTKVYFQPFRGYFLPNGTRIRWFVGS